MKKIACTLLSIMASCLLICSCAQKDNRTALQKIKDKGELVVYTNPNFPPYEYLGKNNTITGCEIDIINKIAERIGVKAKIIAAEFDSIIGTVQTGKADIGASGFTIKEERKELVDFSIPFDRSVQYFIVPADSSVKYVEDLAGKKIGGQNGTTGFMMIEDEINKGILKDTNAVAKSYNTFPDAVVAMKAGQIDVVVVDKLVAISLAKKNGLPCFEVLKKDGTGLMAAEEFGIIIHKGNQDLLDIINAVIKETQESGFYEQSVFSHNEATTQL